MNLKKGTSETESSGNKKKGAPMVVLPDDYSDEDRIGYREYREGISEMIRCVKAKGSFTIGVFGRMGQGKTSMLRQIKKELDAASQKAPQEILTAWFNPWQFPGPEHLLIPFSHSLVAVMEGYREKAKNSDLGGRIKSFLEKFAGVPTALSCGLYGWKEGIERQGPGSPEPAERHRKLYCSLIEELHQAAVALNSRVVVFIDDLDRCFPGKALELLEGLKVLFDIPGFVFVVGAARQIIEQGVRERHKNLYPEDQSDIFSPGQNYLDKLVQFPLSLPRMNPELLRRHVEEDFMKRFPEAISFLDTILGAVGNNPRLLKRFINAVSFSTWVANRKPAAVPLRTELLIKTSLVAFQTPEFYSQICQHPHHLIHMQNILWARESEPLPEASEGERQKEKVEKKTRLREIDRWLEDPYVSRLGVILRRETRVFEGKEVVDQGFKDREEVERCVSMLSPVLPAEVPFTESAEMYDASLKETIEGRMTRIQGGTFRMGDRESGQYDARVSDFWMDIYPVTQSLYQQVSGGNPSRFIGADRPVEDVSWFDAVDFCNRLSKMTGFRPAYRIEGENVEWIRDANGFRLPSETEWEYACRSGTADDLYGPIDDTVWYEGNSKGSTQGVGQKEPNTFGLYDMIGNVWEWVWDWYDDYPTEAVTDHTGPESGSFRVVRGASWFNVARVCRIAIRDGRGPGYSESNLGFRLARSL